MNHIRVVNPATGAEIDRLEADTAAAVAAKVGRARAAQPAWAARPLEERLAALARFADALLEQRESLAETLTAEMGKPVSQARAEIGGTAGRVRFFLEHTAAVIADEVVLREDAMEERISHEPLGTIANISAWNYPYFVGSNVFVPALLTGNCVLYKPSEYASLSGLAITRLLHEAGVPEDCMIAVIGDGSAGAELLRQRIDGIFFTGSYATGRAIAAAVAERMLHLQLELGGKDPLYVCDDATVESAAASAADGAFYNTGQSCCAVERIYVHRDLFDPFVEAFTAQVRGFRRGDPRDEATYIGPLARAAQVEVLEAQVRDALAHGARLLCGGHRADGPGNFFEPTVLVDVDHRMEVMRAESFGPVIGIQKVGGDAEAIALMNDTAYGLTAGVYTPDRQRAETILRQVRSGTSYWNCCDRVSPRLPWSGRGHSGVGVTLSTHGIRTFLQPRAWHLRRA